MITITPDAARELRTLAQDGGPRILRFDAVAAEDGYDCSVALVSELPPEATVEEFDGVTVAFCGEADDVFAGAVIGITADGELVVEMAQGDCSGCAEGDCGCADGGCGPDGSGR